jgi:hypothetical protein
MLSNANGLGGAPVWTQVTASGTAIVPRFGSRAIYDSATNRMIVFGGSVQGSVTNETWVLSNANGVVSSDLTVQNISPTHGGNSGTVTMQILGSGFQDGATVKLTGTGPEIVGTNTTVPNASVLTTQFDLTGVAPGCGR